MSIIEVKEPAFLKGRIHMERWTRHGAIQFADHEVLSDIENAILNVGIDNILQTLGNLITPIRFNSIGVGDGTQIVSGSNSGLMGVNTFYKTVAAVDIVYVRPNLLLTITLAYGDAVFTLAEVCLRDQNNNTLTRALITNPPTKTNSQMYLIQYQISIPQTP